MPIRITASINGFRRAGVAHSTEPTIHPDGFFSEAQLEQLVAEPRLAVELNYKAPADQPESTQGALDDNSVPFVLTDPDKPLAERSVAELKELAEALEIDGAAGLKKAELIAAIEAQLEVGTEG